MWMMSNVIDKRLELLFKMDANLNVIESVFCFYTKLRKWTYGTV